MKNKKDEIVMLSFYNQDYHSSNKIICWTPFSVSSHHIQCRKQNPVR